VTDYSGLLLASTAEIRSVAKQLIQPDDARCNPEIFLASIYKGWKPRVVAVYNASELVGVMYAKERVIAGVSTGVVYADGSVIDIMFGDPNHRERAFGAAVETLLASSRIRGVRFRLQRRTCRDQKPGRFQAIGCSIFAHQTSKFSHLEIRCFFGPA